jgi:hypothetical protein
MTTTSPLDLSPLIKQVSALTEDELAKMDQAQRSAIARILREGANTKLIARCKADALYWLQNHTSTENPLWEAQKLPFVAPFPDKTYFRVLFKAFREQRLLGIPKSRDMMTSWSAVGWATHQAQFNRAFAIIQTQKESKAQQLIGYADCLLRRQDSFISQRYPIANQTVNEIRFVDGGRIMAVPGGENQIRMFKPTLYLMDEAAFLPEAEQCFNATFASSPYVQILMVSSAAASWFGDMCER